MPASASAPAVPPVDTSSTPSSASPRAKSTMPGLVGDRQQRAPDLDLAGRRERLRLGGLGSVRHARREDSYGSSSTRRGSAGSIRTAPRAIRRIASGSSSCSTACSCVEHVLARARVRKLERALQDDRAGVDALVDEVHRDAEDLHPVRERLPDRVEAGEGGQQRRMHVDDARAGSAAGTRASAAACSRRARRAARRGRRSSRRARRRALRGRRSRRAGTSPSARRRAARARARRAGLVGRDRRDDDPLRPAVERVEDRLQVRAGARGEDGEAELAHAAASFGKRPPVERRRPAASSSSTRASTSSRRRWANVPYGGSPS